ncbi:MAG: polysaccharide deacetylase family protein [Proteobacteria bacterium]|nr:polysaccharide deacetylase family protein [Pseudomonadota bacterium]
MSSLACPVLTYHSPNIFANEYGKNDHISLAEDLVHIYAMGKRVIPLTTLVDWLMGDLGDAAIENGVCITFDDGCLLEIEDLEFPPHGVQVSFLNILRAFQKQHPDSAGKNFVVTSFVIASEFDRRQIDRKSLFGLGWMEDDWWAAVQAEGLIDIQSHGWDHKQAMTSDDPDKPVPFARFESVDDYAQCEQQVLLANQKIAAVLQVKTPEFFAYPFGSASNYIREEYLPENRSTTGIRAAFSTEPEHVVRSSDRWNLPRYVCGRDWQAPEQFTALLNNQLATGPA